MLSCAVYLYDISNMGGDELSMLALYNVEKSEAEIIAGVIAKIRHPECLCVAVFEPIEDGE